MSAQRRSRYTVHVEGRNSYVVLAYDPAGARRYFEERGYRVKGVERGDYRIASADAGGGFQLDRAALKDACELLGVRRPVIVRLNGRVGPTQGNHAFNGVCHRIMLKSYLPPEQATRTLWHELTHAMQAERAGSSEAWCEFSRAQRSYSYLHRPIELEARQMEELMGDLPLCLPR